MTSTLTLIKRALRLWSSHDAPRLAAAVGFYFVLAVAPLLVVAVSVFDVVYGRAAEARIEQQVNALVGTETPSPRNAIQQITGAVAGSKHGKLAAVISFVIAIFSGSSLFVCLQNSLNFLWDIGKPHKSRFRVVVRNRLISGAMVIVVIILLLASVALSTAMSIILAHVGLWVTGLSFIGEIILSLIFVTVLFAIIYRVLPQAKIDWADVWLGAAITAGLFVAGKMGLTVYFRFAVMRNAYGAAGSLAALFLWIYYSAMLIFLGAAFTRVYAESNRRIVGKIGEGAVGRGLTELKNARNLSPALVQTAPDTCGLNCAGTVLAELLPGRGATVMEAGVKTVYERLLANNGNGLNTAEMCDFLSANLGDDAAVVIQHKVKLSRLEGLLTRGKLIAHVDGNHYVRILETFEQGGIQWVRLYDPSRGKLEQLLTSFMTRTGADNQMVHIIPLQGEP